MSEVQHGNQDVRRNPVSVAIMVIAVALFGAALVPTPGSSAHAQSSQTATVILVVEGLRSDRGVVMGGLFADEHDWLQNGHEVATCRVQIRRHAARCVLAEIPPGRYAFAFAHDEDSDGDVDRDFLGIPTEGYGFSNGARPGLSAPSFSSAAFDVSERAVQVMSARYGI